MRPSTLAELMPEVSGLPLPALLLAHRPSAALLFDADTALQQDLAQLAETSEQPALGLHLQAIDSKSLYQGSDFKDLKTQQNHSPEAGDSLLRLLPPLSGLDLIYIAEPMLLANTIGQLHAAGQSSKQSAQSGTSVRALALRLLAIFRDRTRGPVYASVRMSRAQSGVDLEANPAAASLTREDFFSLGFVDASRELAVPDAHPLYRYTLRDYKAVPAWLNSKYWAHPERWNISD